ncbi:MAG: hypothetical protein ACREFT_09855, partial [Acetobacteraceae bacterium]
MRSHRLQLIEAQRFALAYAQPGADPEPRIRALETENARLRRHIADLEARQPEPLRERNVNAQAAGERLRGAIEDILATHQGPGQMTRKHVLRALEHMDIGRDKLPSLSAIGWHMR